MSEEDPTTLDSNNKNNKAEEKPIQEEEESGNSPNDNDNTSNISKATTEVAAPPVPAPVPTMEYTNYDVLVDSPEDGVYILENYVDHVGNSRFNVLADMYREAYEAAKTTGQDEECQSIIDRIYDVQCHKSMSHLARQGRILMSVLPPEGQNIGNPDDEWWCELDEIQGKDVVRHALTSKPSDEEEDKFHIPPKVDLEARKRGRTMSLLRRSASESTQLEDKKKTTRVVSTTGSDEYDVEQQQDERNNTSSPNPQTRPSIVMEEVMSSSIREVQLSMSDLGGIYNDTDDDDDDDNEPISLNEIKSGVTLSATMMANIPSSSSSSPPPIQPSSGGGSGGGSSSSSSTGRFVTSHEGLDVVFASNGKQLSSQSGIIGNNRLQVMLTLQTRSFSSSGKSHSEQETIIADLIKAVKVYWGGRLLIEQQQPQQVNNNNMSSSSLTYLEMSPPQAFAAMRALLDGTGSGPPVIVMPVIAPLKFQQNNRTLSSEEILKNGMNPGAQSMQSNAIQSLQARKAKRGLAKSLGRDIVGKTGVEQGQVNPEFVKLKNLGTGAGSGGGSSSN